jgi:hypothetical protein
MDKKKTDANYVLICFFFLQTSPRDGKSIPTESFLKHKIFCDSRKVGVVKLCRSSVVRSVE